MLKLVKELARKALHRSCENIQIMKCLRCRARTRFRKYSSRERKRLGYCLRCFHNYQVQREYDCLQPLSEREAISLTHKDYYNGYEE